MSTITPRVTSISVSRLHNLGNYEHQKYEVTIEVPAGAAPGALLRKLTTTLDDLATKCPVSVWEYQRAVELLAKPHAERTEMDERNLAGAQEHVQRYLAHHQRRKTAFARLDALGMSGERTDHKVFWDDDYDDDPANCR